MSKLKQYTKEELEKVKRVQLEILQEIIRLCNKYSLKWFTVAGTTIGAVRHNGFIPWDDDIDIGMLREDYDKFLEIAPKELAKGYVLAHYSVDKKVPHYFAKVRKDNTLFVEESSRKIKMHHGIFVDIFPHDKVPEDIYEARRHVKKMVRYNQLYINKSTTIPFNKANKYKYCINSCIKKIIKIFICGFSKEYFYTKLDKFVKKYNDTETEMVAPSGFAEFIAKKSDIFPTIKMKFEDIEVEVPNNYDAILKQTYGNYMELPPIEKRFNHAPIVLKFEEKTEK